MSTYHILNAYLQYLKCLLTLFLIPTYSISKNINRLVQLEMVSQIDYLSQEFVNT